MRITVRLFAAARDAVGTAEQELELPEGATAAQTLAALDPDGTATAVLAQCSLLADGEAVIDLGAPLGAVARLDVLPPFAGG